MNRCMQVMRIARVVLLTGALTLGAGAGPGAMPARAQAPPARPSDRAAAREFSFAAYRLRLAVLARKPQVEAGAAKVLAGFKDPRCVRAAAAAPESRRVDVVLVTALIVVGPLYDPIRGPLDTYLAELERVPTADAALRSGRAGWRSEIDLVRRLPSLPDPCAAVQAWQRVGFAPAAAPLNAGALLNSGLDAAEGKLARAGRRMRRLGVSAGAARRFTGDTLFAGVADGLDVTGRQVGRSRAFAAAAA